ncbi:hypothetical protein [Cyclobacterium jeungdonense]|uniref:Uncharacterized protein n=1 Tax=Cyclobacterium jeungdonense TaxID=708087 RepID=A0ABT8CCL8_9BACT|nr:hypothetical protein [Cyclobacterium jeungdonense]MDN3689817.1 hypothetical protein [Cyclobacterium jeungdonense]
MKNKIGEKDDKPDNNPPVNEPASPVCYQNDPEIQMDYQLPKPKPSTLPET